MLQISIREANDIMDKIFQKGDTAVTAFLHSSPGIGKSSIVKQLCKKHSLEMVDLRLASIEPTDLCGIPYVHNGEQLFSIPDWFPSDPKSKGVIFLDELSNASIAVQHVAYRLILDREIQTNRRLPDGWFVVAAGNLKTDQTGVKGIVPALANRFYTHLEIIPNLSDFTVYALENRVDERVVGFLNFNSAMLYRAPTSASTAFPTPRSWVAAAKWLTYDFTDGQLITTLSGCIGEGTATEFLSYMKYFRDLPDFKKIMNGKLEYKVKLDDLGLLFAVATSTMYNLMENHKQVEAVRNLDKVLVQLPEDFVMMVFKTLQQTNNHEMISNLIELKSSYKKIEGFIK